jgi:hypothetical protein
MYSKHLPAELPENWIIAEIDEENSYIEFLGFNEEFLISIMKDTYESPEEPFHLVMNPLKGMLSRYVFDQLDWPEWFKYEKQAVQSALDLMNWMNQNYQNFAPVTLEVFVSIGTEDQLPIIEKYYEDNLFIHEMGIDCLVFKKVNLLRGSWSYSESAIESLSHFAKTSNLNPSDLKGGILTNEKFQFLEDLRPQLKNRINSMRYEKV